MSDYEYPPLRQRVRHLLHRIQSTLLLPLQIATSKTAIRTYLTSIIFFATSFFLLGLAITAYTAFYWSYIPRLGFTREIHLQFDHDYPSITSSVPLSSGEEQTILVPTKDPISSHPWGTTTLAPDLASQQLYDITIHLVLPRTPQNTAQGNFMLDASLLGAPSLIPNSIIPGSISNNDDLPVLAHSRRTAFLKYYSREVDLARKALRLPALLTGLAHETETISIPIFSGVSFPRGFGNTPQTLRVEIQNRNRGEMLVYSCTASFRARFQGLRWIMYNHRIASAVVFVAAFWVTEVLAMGAAWIVLSLFVFPAGDQAGVKSERNAKAVKGETEDDEGTVDGEEDEREARRLSNTERTFPSYAGAPLLKYQHPKKEEADDGEYADRKVKKEEDDGVEPFPPLYTVAEAADDEDEEDDYVLDSGLGTSLESSAGGRRDTSGVKRRKSGRMRTGS